jgi:hypothetical protein
VAGIPDSTGPFPRVDARMEEQNEMTIGRTEDPENPSATMAFEAA